MNIRIAATLFVIALAGCEMKSGPALLLAHDKNGKVLSGDTANIVSAIRQGCDLRVAWGAANTSVDPARTIEHIAEPHWVSVRNGANVSVQIGNFLINHTSFGEPEEDHPRRAEFGGTQHAVKWEAKLKPDGTFDAVWYHPHTGAFLKRVPQRHPMRWYGSCTPGPSAPLYLLQD